MTQGELFDEVAMRALVAIIAKIPLQENEDDTIAVEAASGAFSYARAYMHIRQEILSKQHPDSSD